MTSSERPDLARTLGPLKDFQRRTVDHVFERMYLDPNPAKRFLVADEVGLGKTLVARGVVAKAVDHLWDTVGRIDVVYVCSNADIARQNIDRLNIAADRDVALATRMTLLALHMPDLSQSKLNFLALTPRTSFDPRSSDGRADERALIYRLLQDRWSLGKRIGPIRVLQGDAGIERFKKRIEALATADIDDGIRDAFLLAIDELGETVVLDGAGKPCGKKNLRARFDALADKLRYHAVCPGHLRRERSAVISSLRRTLARVGVAALQPDIVILDEFQRFRDILDPKTEAGAIAQALFDYSEHEGHQARVLLLSATPYKMYTREGEHDGDHYQDFLATVGFLQGDAERTAAFKAKLQRYRDALLRLGDGDIAERSGAMVTAAHAIADDLRQAMVRTERHQAGSSPNAMLHEAGAGPVPLEPADLRAFVDLDRLADEIGVGDQMEYWKSAPYLPNFMDNYVLKKALDGRLATAEGRRVLAPVVERGRASLLDWDTIQQYLPLDIPSAKLRALAETLWSAEMWRMLWLPPSQPYYAAAGDASEAPLTKSLIFSAWKVVPKVIATLLSYEAERRMVGSIGSNVDASDVDSPDTGDVTYTDLRDRRRPLLRFTEAEGGSRLTGMPVLLHLYPSSTLASRIDPLCIAAGIRARYGEAAVTVDRVLAEATAIVEDLVAPLIASVDRTATGIEDQHWYWSVVARLDGMHHGDSSRAWLETDKPELQWTTAKRLDEESDTPTGFDAHKKEFVCHLKAEQDSLEKLGRIPRDLAEVVALAALASPAVCTLRAFMRLWPEADVADCVPVRAAAAVAGMGFRSLFNLPEVSSLIRGTAGPGDDRAAPYWRQVLRHGLDAHLQAVLDEYVHVLRDATGNTDAPAEKAAPTIGAEIASAVSIRTSTLHFDELHPERPMSEPAVDRRRLRCHYAMGFGLKLEEGESDPTRDDQVRKAFNSPFRPFVLASTSIGQEGLDFHWYCRRLYHWNLPSNPVDMEQREGRVNRYKGHAIRRNIARVFGAEAIRHVATEAGGGAVTDQGAVAADPWRVMFDLALYRANRPPDASELDPYWTFCPEGEPTVRVERHVPLLPLSRDGEWLDALKRGLARYRLVFGQPRQEDLVEFLNRYVDNERLPELIEACRMDLSPQREPFGNDA